jgi:hypothetical protein
MRVKQATQHAIFPVKVATARPIVAIESRKKDPIEIRLRRNRRFKKKIPRQIFSPEAR